MAKRKGTDMENTDHRYESGCYNSQPGRMSEGDQEILENIGRHT
jgi:hypothetical protein